MKYIIYYPLN